MNRVGEIWDFLISNEICTEAEAILVTDINGYNEEALNDILFSRTEYHDVEQIYACERYGYDFSMCSFLNDEDEDEEEDDADEEDLV